MGKGRNKNKDKDPYSGPSTRQRDDDSDSDCSYSTHLTFDDDMNSVQGDVDDVESVLDALAEHVENASNKAISIRLSALRLLNLAFTSNYVPEFISKYKATLIDLISKNLKKTDEECIVSALLLANMSIQICEEISEDIAETLSTMRAIVNNSARPEMVRSICALSISVTAYLSSEEDSLTDDCAKSLKQAWTNLKVSVGSSKLFSAALAGWALLLQNSPNSLQDAVNDYQKLTAYLQGELDVRITCGEIIAYIYELARENFSDTFRFPNHQQIIEIIDSYANESTKQKAKKDKRVQRLSFRQIHSCIVDKETPEVKIKFGRESLELDSCSKKLFYELCCDVLHGGMMRHLETNLQLREYFELGPVPSAPVGKVNKIARMAFHNDIAKYRNQVRGKQRDKRSDFC